MSFKSKHFEFLIENSARLVSQEDIGAPKTPADQIKVSAQNIVPGDQFVIYVDDEKRGFGHFLATQWIADAPNTPKLIQLVDPKWGPTIFLSPYQIDWLNERGRIRAVHQAPRPKKDTKQLPTNSLSLTEAQKKQADRLLEVIDHYTRLCGDLNDGRASTELLLRARQDIAEKRGTKPPGKTALYNAIAKLKKYRNIDRACAVAPLPNLGNATARNHPRLEEAIKEAVRIAWVQPKGTWFNVKQALAGLCAPEAEYHDQLEAAAKLSKSTLERRFANVDQYTKDFLRFGEEWAARNNSQFVRLARPDFPLDVVDIDHTTMNIVVFDDEVPVSFGRPDIIVFRDRHSGCVIGFHIGFEAPSFAGFIAGLKHAAYPKDPRTFAGGESWPWYGMPVRIGVDQATHFVGGDMEHAARQLGFQVVEYQAGHPWEKGALEKLFSILGSKLLYRLPGSTAQTPEERKKYEEDAAMAKPVLSLRELYGFLMYYFAKYHNRGNHVGIGPLVTLDQCPDTLWYASANRAPARTFVPPSAFDSLVGYTEEVTIQPEGVRVDYLNYQSAELIALRSHPKHLRGTRKHRSTKYTAIRNPNDLGRVTVLDPYRNVPIEVPIMSVARKYTDGLTLYQHRKIVEFHKERSKKPPTLEELIEAKGDLERSLAAIHAKRKKHGTAIKLARFLSGQATKIRNSEIIELTANPEVTGHLDYADPVRQTPRKAQPPALLEHLAEDEVNAVEPETPPTPEAVSADVATPASIEDIRSRYSDWEE
ncbi:hypothetical protein [Rhizobium sp. BK176]|uniref:hypothetical protein n=1 Tax=Rhizobium sp. BK176 TaxID=2587071 RepID=UPI002167BE2E|nr:hypothetical protein [Rhizobium sp. BK176]MCS4089646.1 putative transposase [Rhizobium sp. BK176]